MSIPIEQKRKDIAKMVAKEVEPGTGYAIIFFEFKEPNKNNYITNGQASHMVQAAASIINRLAYITNQREHDEGNGK